MDVKSEGMGQ